MNFKKQLWYSSLIRLFKSFYAMHWPAKNPFFPFLVVFVFFHHRCTSARTHWLRYMYLDVLSSPELDISVARLTSQFCTVFLGKQSALYCHSEYTIIFLTLFSTYTNLQIHYTISYGKSSDANNSAQLKSKLFPVFTYKFQNAWDFITTIF